MFCRNCGEELTGTSDICPNCGASSMTGTSFCPECGAPTTPLAEKCTNCGTQLSKTVEAKTWKPATAGILSIVVGAIGVTEWVGVAVLEILALGWLPVDGRIGAIVVAVFAVAIASAIVAIVGGISALKRRRWRLAFAGSICAIFSIIWVPILLNVPLAIAAIVLVVLGKGEFR